MNIFQCFSKVLFIETEEDLELVQTIKNKIIDNTDNLKTNTAIIAKKQNFYIVKPQDNLNIVAKKLNMSEEELCNIIGNNKLFIGQIIKY